MRGKTSGQKTLLMVGSWEERIPERHPIRQIKVLAELALREWQPTFEATPVWVAPAKLNQY